jgi:excisionase family DNA binding protein
MSFHSATAVAMSVVATEPVQKAEVGVPKPRARHVNDACRILQISRSHLYAMAAKGLIRLVRVGGRTVVPESEIDRILGEAA